MANISAIADGEAGISVRTKLNEAITEANAVDSKLPAASYTASDVKTKYESNTNTNAYTDADFSKLTGIEAGAEVNVNADWNVSTGDAQILNKPTLGTAAAEDTTAFATAAQGGLADTAVQPGDSLAVPYVAVAASKTLALTDANTEQQASAAATLTIPTNASVAFARGDKVAALSDTTGAVTYTASAGVLLNGVDGGSATLNGQFSAAVITKVGTDAWVINGDHGGVA